MNALIRGLIDDSRSGRARTGQGVVSLVDPGAILHEMRLFKSAGEPGAHAQGRGRVR